MLLDLKKVIITFGNKNHYKELLKDIVHRYELDLLVVYKQIVENDDENFVTRTINPSELAKNHISLMELDEIAKKNTAEIFPASMKNDFGLYTITNKASLLGAASILYSDILEKTEEFFNSPLYLIPSSIHEMIALPEGMVECENLFEMIRQANETVVEQEDILSDHPYFYSKKTGLREILENKESCNDHRRN